MGKKKIDLALVESLARLGVSQQSIAKAICYSECGLSNAKSYNSALREALERGYANSEVDILMAMHNKGLGKHYHDPVGPERDRKLGFDGDSRLMIHLDERLTGGNVKKVQLSGDSMLHY